MAREKCYVEIFELEDLKKTIGKHVMLKLMDSYDRRRLLKAFVVPNQGSIDIHAHVPAIYDRGISYDSDYIYSIEEIESVSEKGKIRFVKNGLRLTRKDKKKFPTRDEYEEYYKKKGWPQ